MFCGTVPGNHDCKRAVPLRALGRLVAGLVAEAHELIGAHGDGCVGPAMAVAEFYFEHAGGEDLDDDADLTGQKALGRQVFEDAGPPR